MASHPHANASFDPDMDPVMTGVEGSYALYLDRVRLMIQRYTLVMNFADGVPNPSNPSAASAAYRALLDEDLDDASLETLEIINSKLSRSYAFIGQTYTGAGILRFERLRQEFALTDLECDLLWLLLAGHLVPSMMWLYRTIWADTSAYLFRRFFLQHVLDPLALQARDVLDAFHPTSTLLANRLIVAVHKGKLDEDNNLFAPSRRVIHFLTGARSSLPQTPGIVALHQPPPPPQPSDDSAKDPAEDAPSSAALMLDLLDKDTHKRLRTGFRKSRRFVFFGADNTAPLRLARELMESQRAPLIEAHAMGLIAAGEEALVMLLGEARLLGAGIFIDRIESLDKPEVNPTLLRRFLELLNTARLPLFLRVTYGLSAPMRLRLSRELNTIEIRLKVPEVETRAEIWKRQLTARMTPKHLQSTVRAARVYPFGFDDIATALDLAQLHAEQRDLRTTHLRPTDIEYACQNLSSQRMGHYAQRVRVNATWKDIVLAPTAREVIDEIIRFGKYRKRVFEDYGYGSKMSYGKGLAALFWGPPGTGKTFVSGLLAQELGYELYRIELSQITSKYIGETEQRLAEIFDEAEATGMAILFDEADSLFSKRTEVKSSNDRYANLEVNFLLQRLEQHEGLVILTTNFPKSLDEAFMRRIRFKAELAAPGPSERVRLWKTMIPEDAPHDPDIDFHYLGHQYKLTGGEIRNAILRAAFYAADEDIPLCVEHLDRAAQHEYKEQGRLMIYED